MPYLDLTIHGANAPADAVDALQAELTALMASVMRKRADLTVVAISQPSGSCIAAGSIRLLAPAWGGRLVVYVTAGTNDDDEKAQFIARAFAAISRAFGEPTAPFYIVVQEVPAGAWGYGGQTQSSRAKADGHGPALLEGTPAPRSEGLDAQKYSRA